MQAFFIGLQFLTRLRVVTQTEWSAENFGKSVRYFPLIGAVLGVVLSAIAYLLYHLLPQYGIVTPHHFGGLVLVISGIILTGGLHCDGFMDTADGVFSGRARERMLEIMKDSRVGANGVMAFGILLLAKYTLMLDCPPERIVAAIFIMPVIARFAMVIGITLFPYARPEGIGKAFAQYANQQTLLIATISTLAIIALSGIAALIALIVVLAVTIIFCRYMTQVLGGMTGDTYGALTELSEIIVLGVFLL